MPTYPGKFALKENGLPPNLGQYIYLPSPELTDYNSDSTNGSTTSSQLNTPPTGPYFSPTAVFGNNTAGAEPIPPQLLAQSNIAAGYVDNIAAAVPQGPDGFTGPVYANNMAYFPQANAPVYFNIDNMVNVAAFQPQPLQQHNAFNFGVSNPGNMLGIQRIMLSQQNAVNAATAPAPDPAAAHPQSARARHWDFRAPEFLAPSAPARANTGAAPTHQPPRRPREARSARTATPAAAPDAERHIQEGRVKKTKAQPRRNNRTRERGVQWTIPVVADVETLYQSYNFSKEGRKYTAQWTPNQLNRATVAMGFPVTAELQQQKLRQGTWRAFVDAVEAVLGYANTS